MNGESEARHAPRPKGRASHLQPLNRFERVHLEADWSDLEHDLDAIHQAELHRTEYLEDDSRSIVSENNSPDIPFRFSVNPYRGCVHGCSYCYARPTHEYLGLSAGLDFESKVVVKRQAAELLREWLARKSYIPESITMSGVTDCYQPAERQFRLTRACLEVALEARQPMSLITKNALIVRDLDLLQPMAQLGIVAVAISLTSLDPQLTREMEPRTSTPAARLRAIRALSEAGIPVHVMTAPIIPGLNDEQIPSLLAAAKDAGARSAAYTLVRLPATVAPVFEEWLRRRFPDRADKVLDRIRSARDGRLNDPRFGSRMSGSGLWGEQIRATFRLFAQHHGLDERHRPLDTSQFRAPVAPGGQLRLF